MRRLLLALIVLSLTRPGALRADVITSTPGGFSTSESTQISSVPMAIFLAITGSLHAWWDPADTPEPLRHLKVAGSERGRFVNFSGGVGPLRGTTATATLTWTLTALRGRTRVEVTYQATGDPALGLATQALTVDAILTDQLQRLKRFVEAGRP